MTLHTGVTVGWMHEKVKSFGGKASCKQEDSRASHSQLLHFICLQLAASVAVNRVTYSFHLKNVVVRLRESSLRKRLRELGIRLWSRGRHWMLGCPAKRSPTEMHKFCIYTCACVYFCLYNHRGKSFQSGKLGLVNHACRAGPWCWLGFTRGERGVGPGEGCEIGCWRSQEGCRADQYGQHSRAEKYSTVLAPLGKPRRCAGAETSRRSLKLQLVPKGTSVQQAVSGVKHLRRNPGTWKSISPGLL